MKPIEVMLVEDNAGDILMVKQAFVGERYPVSIHVAVDGKQAVEIVSQGQFKPAVINFRLETKLSGLGFLEGYYRPDVPVVVFTSSSNVYDQQRALELRTAEYIQKPTDLGEYSRVASQIVRNWAVPDRGK